MAGVIVSVVSINILPDILVAVKSSFLNFDVSNIYTKQYLPPWQMSYLLGERVTSFAKEVMLLVALVYLSVCLLVDITQNVMNGLQ